MLRYFCKGCRRTFSDATTDPCYRQKKRSLNLPLFETLCSAVSMRQTARLFRINRKMVSRRLRFFGEQGKLELSRQLEDRIRLHGEFPEAQFDEMETFEHSKLKPVSIPLIVAHPWRLILAVDAGSMPAKGMLAAKALKKYGKRRNDRGPMLEKLLLRARPYLTENPKLLSDSHPMYPKAVRKCLPASEHQTVLSRAACVVGQGELKRGGFDPLFTLNHTAAMYRAHVSRLLRRTWNTTKKLQPLRDHLILYAVAHNRRILAKLAAQDPPRPPP